MIPESEKKMIVDHLCNLNGEQLVCHENRILPCNMYFLVWDPDYKMCKMMSKEPALKITEPEITEPEEPEVSVPEITEVTEESIPEVTVPITKEFKKLIVQDPADNILGYIQEY